MSSLSKNKIAEMLDESVIDVMDRLKPLNEMVIPLKKYRARVDGLRFQIVENWTLCKYCQLFEPESEKFSHWVRELKTCINNLKMLDIKNGIDKKKTLTSMLVEDYDYDDSLMILRIINDKFDTENIFNNI